jgi:hypothetical protein
MGFIIIPPVIADMPYGTNFAYCGTPPIIIIGFVKGTYDG